MPYANLEVPQSAAITAPKIQLGLLPQNKMYRELLVSGCSVATATVFTNPIDVVKTRMQLENSAGRQIGLVKTSYNVVSREGSVALMSGVTPSVARGFVYGGIRLGLYSPIKSFITKDAKDTISQKLLAGSISGSIAAAVTSPTELIKTRLQSKNALYRGSFDVIKHVVQQNGVTGLWQGAVPAIARAGILTAAQCASYDEIKRRFKQAGWKDSLTTHFTCSMLSGLITTTACNPPDVIKTLMMTHGKQGGGLVAVVQDLWMREGIMGFMKGWTANYVRLGPQTVLSFVINEQLRKYAGMKSL